MGLGQAGHGLPWPLPLIASTNRTLTVAKLGVNGRWSSFCGFQLTSAGLRSLGEDASVAQPQQGVGVGQRPTGISSPRVWPSDSPSPTLAPLVTLTPCPLWVCTQPQTSACTSLCTPWFCVSHSHCTPDPRGSYSTSAPCS